MHRLGTHKLPAPAPAHASPTKKRAAYVSVRQTRPQKSEQYRRGRVYCKSGLPQPDHAA